MVFKLDEVIAFKSAMAAQGITVHLHDTCGGQYFSLDETSAEIVTAIKSYFKARPELTLTFQPNQLGFYLV